VVTWYDDQDRRRRISRANEKATQEEMKAIELRSGQRRFPKLTADIKERYQSFHSIRIEVRTKLFRAIVKAAVTDLHKAGIIQANAACEKQCQSLSICVSLPHMTNGSEPWPNSRIGSKRNQLTP
jgi:hypothetical protein